MQLKTITCLLDWNKKLLLDWFKDRSMLVHGLRMSFISVITLIILITISAMTYTYQFVIIITYVLQSRSIFVLELGSLPI